MSRPGFPFSAIVGQQSIKLALTLCAVDPTIGGVLLSGARGTAKSTIARSLLDLMAKGGECVSLPLGASEERICGTLDLEKALADREVAFSPGLLHKAHNGVLYVDEVNLLADHLVDLLLDASASGVNTVERDGVSHSHAARFVLIGTMNPEEGELRPQLLDRYGLCVAVSDQYRESERVAIVRARLAFDANPERFIRMFAEQQKRLIENCRAARERLSSVVVSDEMLSSIAARCVRENVEGVRADIVIYRAARAHAALHERTEVSDKDIDAVEEFAFAHRRRDVPDNPPAQASSSRHESAPSPSEQETNGGDWGEMPPLPIGVGERREFQSNPSAAPAEKKSPLNTTPARKKLQRARSISRGRLLPSGLQGATIDWLATLYASIADRNNHISNIRYRESRGVPSETTLVLLDTSGSLVARGAMARAKGVIAELCRQAYTQRQPLELIGFSGDSVVTVQAARKPPRDAVPLLDSIGAGGGTPLRKALLHAAGRLRQISRRSPGAPRRFLVFTDARSRDELAGIELDATVHVIDTEQSAVRIGKARRLAAALGGSYRHIDELPLA